MLIHIHEDDWGMRSLHPVEVLRQVQRDLGHSIETEPVRRAQDAAGWTEVHVIEEPDITYADKQITIASIQKVLDGLMPKVTRFYATASCGFDPNNRDSMGSYDEDAICYGFSEKCYLKIDKSREFVSAIWYEACTEDREQLQALRQCMCVINKLVPSLFVDYWEGCCGDISDSSFLDAYFQELFGEEHD